VQRWIAAEFDAKGSSGHAQRITTAPHERPDTGNTHPEDERHPGHSLIAHHSNLQRTAFVGDSEQGNKAIDREVDMPNRLSRSVQHLSELQTHRLELRLQPRELVPGEAGDYRILPALRIRHHFGVPRNFL
jgi:hypothetical protein